MFRYGFEATKDQIISEWLYHRPKTKEIEVFFREKQSFNLHRDFSVGRKLVDDNMVRENALMISVASQFNDKISSKVFEWMFGFRVITALDTDGYKGYSMNSITNPKMKKKILDMLNKADIAITDLELRELDVNDSKIAKVKDPELIRFLAGQKKQSKLYSRVFATHDVFDSNNLIASTVAFDLEEDESSGTNQFLALSGPIIDVIEHGWVLAVDELDSKLHPVLVQKIVEIFNSKEINRKNSQLIFNTHDTNLLSADLFRRDQIWFVKKNRFGAATLYSLADFKSTVRKLEKYEKNYMSGKYGAIPAVSDIDPGYHSTKYSV
jgi:AAA15 family ATPase/GTPase